VPGAAPPPPIRSGLVLTVLLLTSAAFLFASVMVVPAFPDIARELGVDEPAVAWLLTAPLLVGGITPPLVGRFADVFGKRRLFLVVLAVFLSGTVAAGVSAVLDSYGLLIVARVLQGFGGNMFPLSVGIIRDCFPRERQPFAFGFLSAGLGVGGGAGLLVAGPIIAALSWDWLFWSGAIVLGLALLAGLLVVPESPVRAEVRRIDWAGALLLVAGLLPILLVISEGADWGWTGPVVLTLVPAGAVVLLGWVWWESRTPEPLVDLRLLRAPAPLTLNVQTFLVGLLQFGFLAMLPLYVAVPPVHGFGFGANATAAGLFMLPSTIMMVLVAPVTGVVTTRFGANRTLAAGGLALAASTGWFLLGGIDPWEVYASNALFGAGYGMAIGAISTLVVASVEPDRTGVAAGINAFSRAIGGALGAPVATALITTGAGFTDESGYRVAFAVFTAIAVATALVSAAIPSRGRQESATSSASDSATKPARTSTSGRASRSAVKP
jgi:MFS family permease